MCHPDPENLGPDTCAGRVAEYYRSCCCFAAAVQHNARARARTTSGPPSTGAVIAMDGARRRGRHTTLLLLFNTTRRAQALRTPNRTGAAYRSADLQKFTRTAPSQHGAALNTGHGRPLHTYVTD